MTISVLSLVARYLAERLCQAHRPVGALRAIRADPDRAADVEGCGFVTDNADEFVRHAHTRALGTAAAAVRTARAIHELAATAAALMAPPRNRPAIAEELHRIADAALTLDERARAHLAKLLPGVMELAELAGDIAARSREGLLGAREPDPLMKKLIRTVLENASASRELAIIGQKAGEEAERLRRVLRAGNTAACSNAPVGASSPSLDIECRRLGPGASCPKYPPEPVA